MTNRSALLFAVLAGVLQACSCGGNRPCPQSGSCGDGQVCDTTSARCRPPKACGDEGFCAQSQECQAGAAGADAVCLESCTGGLFWDYGKHQCGTVPPGCGAADPNSLLAKCTGEHRSCDTTAQMATCGACVAGYQDFAGKCEVPATCADLSCAAENRACVDTPNGHCAGCLPDFVEDVSNKQCRPPVSCTNLTCPSGQFCIEPSGVADARCDTSCGANALLGPDGKTCHACPACTNAAAGERGPYLGGLTGSNQCICQTAPGYFWREDSRAVSPCDADGDGWVRESAKLSMDTSDPVVKANARCALRRVRSLLLENDRGQPMNVPLSPLELYETDRNDDAALLAQQVAIGKVPASYGATGRQLTPAELNSFTKYCSNETVDYNENGLADVNEWQGNPNLGQVKTTFRGFAPYAYFGELHRGWYEAPAGGGSGPGTWHVQERSRLAGAAPGAGVELAYAPDAGAYGRSCDRLVDSDFFAPSVDRNGMDFASFAPSYDAGYAGMTHHSQFKCVQITAQPSAKPHWLTPSQVVAQGYVLNDCTLTASATPPPSGVDPANPSAPALSCAATSAIPAEHQVRWANLAYQPYSAGGYRHGCVNECAEYPFRCPGYDKALAINPSSCFGDLQNFGRLQCACDYRFSGVSCERACPGDPTKPAVAMSNLFLDPNTGYLTPDGGLAPTLTGYWMCGKPSATAYATQPFLGELWDGGTDGGYYLEGEISTVRATAETLSEDGDGGGYAIR